VSKRTLALILALSAAGALGAAPAHAQGVRFGFAGTGLFSLEDGGGSDFGVTGLAQFGRSHGNVGFRIDASLLRGDDQWSQLATGDVSYTFHTPESLLHPYLLAGAGIVHVPDLTKPMAKAGGGLDYHLFKRNRGTVLFGEATVDFLFFGDDAGGTATGLQLNLGLKFGD
jgi:hypothetical protein